MNITILDRCTVTRGDIDLGIFAALGTLRIHDVIPGERLIETIQDADAVLCNKGKDHSAGHGAVSPAEICRIICNRL